MTYLRVKISILLLTTAYILNGQSLKKFAVSYNIESTCSSELPFQFDLYVDSTRRICSFFLESGIKISTISEKGSISGNIDVYLENAGLKAKVLDINEWNASKVGSFDIKYLEADSFLLGLPTSRLDVEIFSMKVFTIDYIKDIKIDNSLFLPTYQSMSIVPLRIEVFDDRKCNKYVATTIEYDPPMFDSKSFIGYKEMLLEDVFNVIGSMRYWFSLFEIFSPVIYESKN